MRNALTVIALAGMTLLACKEETPKTITTDMIFNDRESDDVPKMVFEEDTFDFGKIVEGEKVNFTYKFTNEGNLPLILGEVIPSCGCTTPKDWTKTPSAPGDEGELEVVFDSAQRVGEIEKSVSVYNNGNPPVVILKLKGTVIGLQSK